MEMIPCRVVTIEVVRPYVPGATAVSERVPVLGISKLKLTLLDEEQLEPSVDREFLCVDGERQKQIMEELRVRMAVWI